MVTSVELALEMESLYNSVYYLKQINICWIKFKILITQYYHHAITLVSYSLLFNSPLLVVPITLDANLHPVMHNLSKRASPIPIDGV